MGELQVCSIRVKLMNRTEQNQFHNNRPFFSLSSSLYSLTRPNTHTQQHAGQLAQRRAGGALILEATGCRANAWEEGDEVILITCRLENPDLDLINGTVHGKLQTFKNELYELRFNMKTGAASQKQLSASTVDFPRINESYTGRKSEVNVIDAKRMSADPVAVVELPSRVPLGFHAFFVTEEQLKQQEKL
ncbi:hypothetical protein Taro_047530 [Colocasia esculenta]|uniref:carotenoid 9,10-dioxygenase n=1 Tax=Colocasia esculenta TaxID=4460 RepID=A0A843X116_COLES|nr:hypothetical protein [Colocasia esculenta]